MTETAKNAVRTAEKSPAWTTSVNEVYEGSVDTHENEKIVDVVRKVANHVFVMSEHLRLDNIPALGRGITLRRRG